MSSTVLITGANSGIGKELAFLYAKRGARLFLTVRNQVTADTLETHIKKKHPTTVYTIYTLDLGSLKSVRTFCDLLAQEKIKIDTVILNAGIHIPFSSKKTVDGYEQHYQINYLSNVVLVNQLQNNKNIIAQAQIVYISSTAHRLASGLISKLNQFIYNYAYSKFCATTYFLRFSELNPSFDIKIIHPGLVETSIHRYKSGLINHLDHLYKNYLSHKLAADNILNILSIKDKSVYWEVGKKSIPAASCYDYALSSELWNKTSHELTEFLPESHQIKLFETANWSNTYTSLSPKAHHPKALMKYKRWLPEPTKSIVK
ncbi:MAG: SDR family NAD(P)-dependent oxidoreductase [bacterium]|nr:SDR family NAD(P)-dependent oxidoreductase [bacterium]